ncbi:DnaJ domain family protein [Leishmania donovani]|uniref:DnaJ domain family protein n=1 Tax=Leishmania donovani TaxID=5661 RepID=A0A504Y0V1_LEIDO|nr:DnaJ domain family protein [Leishmania donovani]
MQPSTLSSLHGVSSSALISTSAALHDPTGATDEEIVECVLLIWRDVSAAAARRHAPSHPAVMHPAALRIFGHDSLQSAAMLRRRYRQLAIRVHPDKNTSSRASEAFQLLQSCFEYLVSSREARGIGGVDVGGQTAFQRTADPSRPEKGDAFRRGDTANGEDAKSAVFADSPTHRRRCHSWEGPPDVFATSAGTTAAAAVPAPNVFDHSSSDPAVPPPPVFDAHPAFKAGSTGAAQPRIRRRASTGVCTSFAGTASDFGPAPPLVFEPASSTPTDTSARAVIARQAGVAKQHSSKQQRSARQPELPTLAELLARLDADDDEDEGGSENTVEWTRGLSSRDGSNGSAARGCRTYETAAVNFSAPPARLWLSTAHPAASHSRSNTSDSADLESSGAPVNHRTSMTADPVHLDMSCATSVSSAPSSTPSTLEAFYSALQEEAGAAAAPQESVARAARPLVVAAFSVKSKDVTGDVVALPRGVTVAAPTPEAAHCAAVRQEPALPLAPFAAFARQFQDANVTPSFQQIVDMNWASWTQQLFEFLEAKTGACGGLLHMCFFCYPATVSYGMVSDSTSKISGGSRMTAQGLAGNLHKEDVAVHFNEMHRLNAPEPDVRKCTPAAWPAYEE